MQLGEQRRCGADKNHDIAHHLIAVTHALNATFSPLQISAYADGAVSVSSGGYIIFAEVTTSSNALSINGALTMNGKMEVWVTSISTGLVPRHSAHYLLCCLCGAHCPDWQVVCHGPWWRE